jgi:hypothetical protein
VKIDVEDNDWLKKNQRRYVKAVQSDVRDNDRLKKIAEAMRKLLQAMCRIMICSKKYRGRNA